MWVVLTAAVGIIRSLLGLWGALGTDAALWGLTARDLLVGAAPLVPPLYPGLLAPLVALGLSPITAGNLVSAASLSALLCIGHALARALGATRRQATWVSIALLVIPDIPGWGFQLQPDATAAAVGLLLALGLVRVHRSGARMRDALFVVLVAGLAPLLREHGLVWSVVGMAGLAVCRPGLRRFAWLVPAVVWCAPVLTGVLPGAHPLDVPWADRAGGAFAAFLATEPGELSFLRELNRSERGQYAAFLTQSDRLGQWLWHLRRTLRLAPDGWLLILGAVVLGIRAGRRHNHHRWWVVLLPLVSALPALVIWSQRRHVLLVAPIALVVIAVLAVRDRRLWMPLSAVLVLHGAINWPGSVRAWRSERPRAEHYAELGAWLQEHSHPGDLLGGVHQDVGLYAPPMPRHDPDGSAADWRTFFVSEHPPPPPATGTWQVVFQGPQLLIWQLEPERDPRPCADIQPPSSSAHLAIARAQVVLSSCPLLTAP